MVEVAKPANESVMGDGHVRRPGRVSKSNQRRGPMRGSRRSRVGVPDPTHSTRLPS